MAISTLSDQCSVFFPSIESALCLAVLAFVKLFKYKSFTFCERGREVYGFVSGPGVGGMQVGNADGIAGALIGKVPLQAVMTRQRHAPIKHLLKDEILKTIAKLPPHKTFSNHPALTSKLPTNCFSIQPNSSPAFQLFLAFLQHLHCFDNAALPCFCLLRFFNPLDIFFLMRIRQLLKSGPGFFVGSKRPLQLRRDGDYALFNICFH
jgi:hypothetical protein